MTIAVDFDGTIVEHRYPAIGRERPFATATLRQLMKDGHKLILWTVREGELLDEAVEWCKEKGVRFYAINSFFDEDAGEGVGKENNNPSFSRKLKVDCFIDDRNVGGLPDWAAVYQIISRKITFEEYLEEQAAGGETAPKKKHWWNF